MAPRTVRVWCHGCGDEDFASVNSASEDLCCVTCHGSFVEELHQGLDEFLGDPSDLSPASENEGSSSPTSSSPSYSSPASSVAMSSQSSPLSQSELVHPPHNGEPAPVREADSPASHLLAVQSIVGSLLSSIAPGSTSIRLAAEPRRMVIRQRTDPLGLTSGTGLALLSALSVLQRPVGISSDNASFDQLLHHILMNESSHAGVPPAAQTLIDGLQRHTMNEETFDKMKGECSISQEMFEMGDVVISLPCGHRYKEDSIVHWLQMHSTCPVCRIHISETPVAPST